MADGRFISYLRVSTQKQGRSGLGEDAQRQAVENFLNGGSWRLLAEYREIEHGDNDDRPELARAINDCRLRNATLVIAKLDRLTRDLHFLTGLQKAGIKFVAADMPEANELTVHIMAAMAQHERKMIGRRTTEALAAAKRRGTRLGNPNGLSVEAQAKGAPAAAAAKAERVAERDRMLAPVIADIRGSGLTSLRQIGGELNAREVPAPRGGKWSAGQVLAVLRRLDRAAS
jgi:DNA invertase Pin-like site-specific DNA recombinase